MPMPSVTDLQTMYGAWNPQAYMTAQDNAGLERQYRESELGRQRQLEAQSGLDTIFKQQDDPNRIQERVLSNRNRELSNEGLGYANRTSRVNADIAEETKQFKINEAQRKDLLGASEQDIAMGEATARKLMMSLDPNERKQGEQLYSFTKYARDEQEKHRRAVEAQAAQDDAAMARQKVQTGGQIKVAEIGAASRVANAGNRGTASSISLLPKLSPDKRLGHVRAVLESNVDPDTKEPLTPAARAYYQTLYDQDAQYLDAKPAPAAGVTPVIGPEGKVTIAPAPARPSVRTDSGRESKGSVAPAVGTVKGGYIFLGGDPANQNNWRKQ